MAVINPANHPNLHRTHPSTDTKNDTGCDCGAERTTVRPRNQPYGQHL
ncbi:hypothetical protein [Neobacillus cucumis]